MSTYNTILAELQKSNTESTTDIYVPSQEQNVTFRQLNVKAQKNIIRSALSSDGTNISFNLHANEMIYSHTETRNLLVTDRAPVLLGLRNENLDSNIVVEETTIGIDNIISTYEQKLPGKLKLKSQATHESITVFMTVPTLETDTKFLKQCQQEIKGMLTEDTVGESVGTMYLYELAKVVDRIQYKMQTPALSGEEAQVNIHTVKFENTSVPDCLSMIELLPASINKKLVEFITQIREFESLTCTDPESNVQIPIDVSLFTLD